MKSRGWASLLLAAVVGLFGQPVDAAYTRIDTGLPAIESSLLQAPTPAVTEIPAGAWIVESIIPLGTSADGQPLALISLLVPLSSLDELAPTSTRAGPYAAPETHTRVFCIVQPPLGLDYVEVDDKGDVVWVVQKILSYGGGCEGPKYMDTARITIGKKGDKGVQLSDRFGEKNISVRQAKKAARRMHSWFGDVSEFVEEGQLDRIDALLTHKSVPKSFETSREAAKWAVWLAYPETQKQDWEWGGFIYKGKDDKFLISKSFTSKQRTSVQLREHLHQYPAAVAWWHTHPDYSRNPDGYGSEKFSDNDHAFTRDMKKWAARKGRKDVSIFGYAQVYTGRVIEESGSSDWHKTLVVSPEAEEDKKWFFYHSHLLLGGDPKRKETE